MVRRFHTYDFGGRRVWLRARTVCEAITEVENGDHTVLGQVADIYDGRDVAVAVMVDVKG